MDRPYIVCLMSTSLDGKITGSYMDTPEAENSFEEYERANQFYQPQAWINGRVTVDENFTFYEKPDLAAEAAPIPHEDHVALTGQENYLVAADPSGRLGWKQNYVEYAGRPKAYVIELLTEQVVQYAMPECTWKRTIALYHNSSGYREGKNPRGNSKFCVTAKSGANRVKFIMGGRRIKRLPPCLQHNANGTGCQGGAIISPQPSI